MIKIEERKPKKLAGLTSFFISFDFNRDIIDIIKRTGLYDYNKKTKEWEVSVLSLSSILDSLTFLDDIQLILLKEKETTGEQRELTLNYKIKPYKYQLEAIKYGIQDNHKKWLLLDGMGCGKTAEIIHIAEELKYQKGLKHCFIICAVNSLKSNWKKEIKLHSNESCKILGEKISKNGKISYGSVLDRVNELNSNIEEFFIITNIETIRSKEFIKAFKKNINNIDMIVCDEVHRVANQNSIQGDAFLKLNATYKIAATGTLLVNSPLNLFVPLSWIDIEQSNLTMFKKTFCEKGGFAGKQIIGYKNTDLLKEELEFCSLRRTKEDVLKDLPSKTIIKEYISLSTAHQDFYNNVVAGVKEECDKIILNTKNTLALSTRLRQATSCPSIITSNDILSSKIERAEELVDDLISVGEKVVIFSVFKETIYKLAERLKNFNPLICTGDISDNSITEAINSFQTDNNKKLLLGTSQKMGTGITLTAASYMIFIDTPLTAADFNQACDRIYRIGTEKPVFIYNLICENTIDEHINEIISRKQALSDYIIDDNISEQTIQSLAKYIREL